jgi:hypothetical protein
LQVVQSAGSRVAQLKRVTMEVIADDCHVLYTAQPRCSQVIAQMAALNFTPARCAPARVANFAIWSQTHLRWRSRGERVCCTVALDVCFVALNVCCARVARSPTPCVPRFPRRSGSKRTAFGCELEVLFLGAGLATGPASPDVADRHWQYHNIALNGCTAIYEGGLQQQEALARAATNGSLGDTAVFVHHGSVGVRFYGTGRCEKHNVAKYSTKPWIALGGAHAYGHDYYCPESRFAPNATLASGVSR